MALCHTNAQTTHTMTLTDLTDECSPHCHTLTRAITQHNIRNSTMAHGQAPATQNNLPRLILPRLDPAPCATAATLAGLLSRMLLRVSVAVRPKAQRPCQLYNDDATSSPSVPYLHACQEDSACLPPLPATTSYLKRSTGGGCCSPIRVCSAPYSHQKKHMRAESEPFRSPTVPVCMPYSAVALSASASFLRDEKHSPYANP